MKILLHDISRSIVTQVFVDEMDPINVLLKDRSNAYLIYNDTILISLFTFALYGISDGSHVYIYETQITAKPKKLKKRNTENFLELTFHDILLYYKRIDTNFMRYETNSRFQRKIASYYSMFESLQNNAEENKSEEIYKTDFTANSPSTSVLPICWKENCINVFLSYLFYLLSFYVDIKILAYLYIIHIHKMFFSLL